MPDETPVKPGEGSCNAPIVAALLVALSPLHVNGYEPLRLHAAGSLKAALSDVARAFSETYGVPVETTFGAAGLLRQRIERDEPSDVFASANMTHPRALARDGKGGPVVLFARNHLCALARSELRITSGTLLDTMLCESVRLGTSTPKTDPSGDYAWQLFRKADALRPGSYQKLDMKALRLTGGPDSPKAPDGRNTYGWVMQERKADLFLTYRTSARLAQAEVPGLRIVEIPEPLAVGADYGLVVLDPERPEAWRLAFFILSPEGQRILRDHGFITAGIPDDS